MEAEFVNIFVEKQRESIVDLTSRNIMLEARLAFAAKTAEQAAHQTEDSLAHLQKSLEESQAHVIAVREEGEYHLNAAQQAAAEKDKVITHLKTRVGEQSTEIDTLKATIKQLKIEQEVQLAKATRLKNKAKQLVEE